MATTRSKVSSAEKVTQDEDLVPLSIVKELLKAQETTMKSFLTAFVEETIKRIDKRIDDLSKEVKSIITSLEFTQEELKDLKEVHANLKKSTASKADLECAVIKSWKRADEVKEPIEELEVKVDYLENHSRRNNLCFDGIKEDANESWSDSEEKVRKLLSTNLKVSIDDFTIERAHRVGKNNQAGKPRTIVVKINNYKTKEAILKSKRGLKGTNVFVHEDFSQKVLTKRKELLPKIHEERKNGNIAFLRYDKLAANPGKGITGAQPSSNNFSPAGRGQLGSPYPSTGHRGGWHFSPAGRGRADHGAAPASMRPQRSPERAKS